MGSFAAWRWLPVWRRRGAALQRGVFTRPSAHASRRPRVPTGPLPTCRRVSPRRLLPPCDRRTASCNASPHRLIASFAQDNSIELIARAHQLVMEGYKHMFNDTLVTVWSAPNYCYRCGNVAAILELDEHINKNFKIFEAAPQEARGVPAKKPAPDYFL